MDVDICQYDKRYDVWGCFYHGRLDKDKDLNVKSGLLLKKFFNTSGQLYREMELSKKLPTMSDDAMLDLLASDGMLVKRPLLITDKKVLVGFKEDEWKEACL
jgi:arsenate reductase